MRRLLPIGALALTLLTGCAAAAPATESAPAPAAQPAEGGVNTGSLSEVTTLEGVIAYVRELTPDTPDLANKMVEVAQMIPRFIVPADLPPKVGSFVSNGVITLTADLINDPSSAGGKLGDLNALVDTIESSR